MMVVSAIQCKRSLFPFEQTNKQTNSLEILFSAKPPNMVLSLTMFPAITQRPVSLRYTAPCAFPRTQLSSAQFSPFLCWIWMVFLPQIIKETFLFYTILKTQVGSSRTNSLPSFPQLSDNMQQYKPYASSWEWPNG